MHYAFGWYTFEVFSTPIASGQKTGQQRTARSDPALGEPHYQMLGPGAETITLSGTVAPGVNGETAELEQLNVLRRAGNNYPLINGSGDVLGRYFIDSVTLNETDYWPNGEPKEMNFTVAFTRDFDAERYGDLTDSTNDDVTGEAGGQPIGETNEELAEA